MKYFIKITFVLIVITSASNLYAENKFDIRIQPTISQVIDAYMVYVSGPQGGDKYNNSHSKNLLWTVEVRGQCPDATVNKKWRISKASLLRPSGDDEVLKEGSTVRSLTANSGATWEAHDVAVSIPAGQQKYVQACNNEIKRLTQYQGMSLPQALNSGAVLDSETGYEAKLDVVCEDIDKGGIFQQANQFNVKQVYLPVQIRCLPVSYEPPEVVVSQSSLILKTKSKPVGICEVKTKAELIGDLANKEVSFRYQYGSYDGINPATKDSSIYKVTTNSQGVANFEHVIPVHISEIKQEKGKLRMVGTSTSFTSEWVYYEMDCKKPATTTYQNAPQPPNLSLKVTPFEEVESGGQICPTKIRWQAGIDAVDAVEGNLFFLKNNYFPQKNEFKLYKGQKTKIQEDHEIGSWGQIQSSSGVGVSNTIAGNESELPIKTQMLELGYNITDKDGNVLYTYPKTEFLLKCRKPIANAQVQTALGGDKSKAIPTTEPMAGTVAKPNKSLAAKKLGTQTASPGKAVKGLDNASSTSTSTQQAATSIQSNELPDLSPKFHVYDIQGAPGAGAYTLNAEDALSKKNGLCIFKLDYAVRNTGNVNTSNKFSNVITLNGKSIHQDNNVEVAAKGIKEFRNIKIGLAEGMNDVRAIADHTNKQAESKENNNMNRRNIKVIGSCKGLAANTQQTQQRKLKREAEPKEPAKKPSLREQMKQRLKKN